MIWKRKQLQKLDFDNFKAEKTKTGSLPTRTHDLSSTSRTPYRLTNDNAKNASIIINSRTLV